MDNILTSKISLAYTTPIANVTDIIIGEYGVQAALEFKNPVDVLKEIADDIPN